ELNSIKARILHKYGVKLTEKGSTWNKMQLKILEQTFSLLPASFVKQTTNISREPLPPPGKSPLIAAYIYKGSTKVHLLDWGSQMSPQYLEDFKKAYRRPPIENDLYRALVDKIPGTLAHEMTHCFQSKNPAITAAWKKKFNFRDSPTLYGKTNDREDMAESVKLFFLGGKLSGNKFIAKTGEKMDLDRYNFIKNNIMSGKEFIGSNIPKFF
ncbi:MAG: hypothetical protein JXL97_01325, partial [Bacteroidales bacterium]|nr:hypothetical protein [Bacteroidales bacterium]